MASNNETKAREREEAKADLLGKRNYRRERFEDLRGREDVSRRRENVKDFDLGAGRHQLVIYPHGVHYKDGDEWREIDNTLDECIENGARVLRNRDNPFRVTLPRAHGNNAMSIEKGGRRVSWRFAFAEDAEPAVNIAQGDALKSKRRANVRGKKFDEQDEREDMSLREAVTEYTDIAPNVDTRVTLQGESLKQDIILKSMSALDTATLEVTAQGAHLTVCEDERVLVVDNDTDAPLFTFSAPYTHDAAGHDTIAHVRLGASDKPDTTVLWYELDAEFVTDAVFPVTIDPLVESAQDAASIQDNYVSSKSPSTVTSYTGATLRTCNGHSSYGTCYTFIKHSTMPVLDSSCTVTKAYLKATLKAATTSDMHLGVRGVTAAWNPQTITYNNAPAVSPRVLDYLTIESNIAASSTFGLDISNLVRSWYENPASNYGVRLELLTTGTGAKFDMYSSDYSTNTSYRPVFIINYVSNAGLGASTKYDEYDCGRAGTASVNVHNGNVVIARPLTSCDGSRMPVSVTAYYNSCFTDQQAYSVPMGSGWKLSCDEYLTKETITTSTGTSTYYRLHMVDGTQLYFESSSGSTTTYKDMDGLNLTLTVGSSNITIKDKQDNVSTYQTISAGGRITKIANALGVETTFTYTSGRLTKITDGSGRVTNLYYNTNNRLSAVAAPGTNGDRVEIDYDPFNSTLLSRFIDRDGKYGEYTMQSIDGQTLITDMETANERVNFLYSLYIPHRVGECTEYALVDNNGTVDFVAGRKCGYDFGDCMTKVIDTTIQGNHKSLLYHFNDWGNVVSVQDELGHAQFASFPTTNLPNHPSEVSKLQRVVCNLFPNHNFEGSTGWSFTNLDNASGTMSYSTTDKMMGTRSVKVVRNNSTGRQNVYIMQTLPANTKLTASVYIKGGTGMTGEIRINSSDLALANIGDSIPLNSEWQRMSVSFTTTTEQMYWVSILTSGAAGTAYIDCAQLEYGDVPNQYNLLQNAEFDRVTSNKPDDWTEYDSNTSDDCIVSASALQETLHPTILSDKILKLTSNPAKTTGIYQIIPQSGAKGDVYVVGGWAHGYSKPIKGEERRFCIRLSFKVDGSYVNAGDIKWNDEWTDWQYASGVCIAPNAYTSVRFDVSYQRNVNEAYFDGLVLYKETFGHSYVYDSEGKVVNTSTLTGAKSYTTYDDSDNVDSYRQPGRSSSEKYTMFWGTSTTERKKHLLNNVQSPMGVVNAYDYDSYGNKTLSRTRNTARTLTMQSTAEYAASEGSNYVTKQTDARGNAVTFAHDANTGTLSNTTLPNGQQVAYQYDSMHRLTSVQASANGGTVKNEYTYSDAFDSIETVKHNTTGTASDVQYSFGVNIYGDPTTTKVGTQTLSTNVYTSDAKHQLTRTEFGNGGKIEYVYDSFDRVIGIKQDNDAGIRLGYMFGANGQVTQAYDNHLCEMMRTERDLAERISKVQVEDEAYYGHSLRMTYDDYNNVSSIKERIGNLESNAASEYETTYVYDTDNRPTTVQFGDATRKVVNTYDALGRVNVRKVYNGSSSSAALTSNYAFLAGAAITDTTSTTPLVSTILQNGHSFAYTYDAQTSNITVVRQSIGSSLTTSNKYTYYVYDSLGQLVRVNDQTDTSAGSTGTTWVYAYDFGGNITSKKRYAYQTGTTLSGTPVTTTYAYTDSNWKDKVTSIGGQALIYDAIGNITNDGTWAYTWQAGRQLAGMSKAGTTIAYEYNINGMRAYKMVNGVETKYFLNGSTILHMKKGTDELHFYYDGGGDPALVEYSGERYIYVRNLQGDIVGLLDSTGSLVVSYGYDAWGKPYAPTGSMASTLGALNPFRYRGYVWDEETQLYYLQSRYYNPAWGRFINADNVMGKTGALLAHNLFAYCKNNPVQMRDANGHAAVLAIGLVSVLLGIAGAAIASGIVRNSSKISNNVTSNAVAGIKNRVSDVVPHIPAPVKAGASLTTSVIMFISNPAMATFDMAKSALNVAAEEAVRANRVYTIAIPYPYSKNLQPITPPMNINEAYDAVNCIHGILGLAGLGNVTVYGVLAPTKQYQTMLTDMFGGGYDEDKLKPYECRHLHACWLEDDVHFWYLN